MVTGKNNPGPSFMCRFQDNGTQSIWRSVVLQLQQVPVEKQEAVTQQVPPHQGGWEKRNGRLDTESITHYLP